MGEVWVAKQTEPVDDGCSNRGSVLADPAGENQRVEAWQCGGDAGDAGGSPSDEHVEGQLSTLVACSGGLFDLPHAGLPAENAHQAGLVIERRLELAPACPTGAQHI